jgi:hypothetical protein
LQNRLALFKKSEICWALSYFAVAYLAILGIKYLGVIMVENNNNTSKTGPQGTQVFEVNEVNKMIAKEIIESRSPDASLPALIGISNDVIGQQYVLNKDKMEIGRRPNSDIVLTEASVSSMHAQIIRDGENWKILNLLSSNGTFVNSEKVVEQVIVEGDMIGFAGSEFVFSKVEAEKATSQAKKSNNLVIVLVVMVIAVAALMYSIL